MIYAHTYVHANGIDTYWVVHRYQETCRCAIFRNSPWDSVVQSVRCGIDPQWRSTSNMRLKSAQSVSSSPLLKAFARRGHRIARSILHLRNVSLGGPSHSFASRRMQNRLRYLVHCRTEKWRLREPPIFSFSILVS